MKYLKTYEMYKEIYQLNTEEPVVIKDELLSEVEAIENDIEKYRGKAGKMEYQIDDFFSYLKFDDRTIELPSYMLINQDEYELNNGIKKYNI